MRIKRSRARDIIRNIGKALHIALKTKSAVSKPHEFALSQLAKAMIQVGNYRKRYGYVRNTFQVLNRRTGRWVKFRKDPRTKQVRIVDVKKTPGPYKNVRKLWPKISRRSNRTKRR